MHTRLVLLALISAFGCKDEVTLQCEEVCTELVINCAYEAYPDLESCQDGCLYEAEEGADIEDHLDCVTDADCDLFEIIECEHEEGSE